MVNQTPVSGGNPGPDVEVSTEDYARRFAGPTGAWFLRVQADATLRMLRPWPGATILDVGGGHGQLTGPLAAAGYRVTVLGSDPRCSRLIEGMVRNGGCSFATGDLLALPYPDRSFDVVTAFRLLAHLPEWRRFIGELARVARHAVIIDFAATRSLNVLSPLLFRLKHRVEGNTRPFALFKEADLVAEFGRHSFTPSERYGQFFLPMAGHRALNTSPLSRALEAPFRWSGLTSLLGSPVIMRLVRQG
jgi:2-polyprenyl-3-methyl-5-hydroxy-6-metoxy-1,4-benzoquinol methylase